MGQVCERITNHLTYIFYQAEDCKANTVFMYVIIVYYA